jgi:penicillin-binding protein 1A
MSDDVHSTTPVHEAGAPIPFAPPRRRRLRRNDDGRATRPRVRKFRLALILVGFAALALVSTAFGMMMAVAQDLPQLENFRLYHHAANSMLYDDQGNPIGIFAPPNNVVVVEDIKQISPYMQHAIVAVEDKRFYSNSGIDFRGIARAVTADVTGGSALQGASTIEQQFVKVALTEQSNRTIFEKLREAAMAYNLDHRWSKAKILREYLNTIYFGNGAYGIESAARVYFGSELGFVNAGTSTSAASGTTTTAAGTPAPPGACGDPPLPLCASKLQPYQAALLAGMVASPAAYDPVREAPAARARRNLVLLDMYRQRYITGGQYETAIARPLPTRTQILQPQEPTAAPYFTSWLAPQILAAMGSNPSVAEYRAYYGGLKIRTTLDLPLQRAAEAAVSNELPPGYDLPSASLVAIDNKTGEVRAMVGGPNYQTNPFNLATQGLRQPGSSFKPFTLAAALEDGISPSSTWVSAPQNIKFAGPGGVVGHFIVHNFQNTYSGTNTLLSATTYSDNSIYAQVGMKVGTRRIARMAHQMGIRTPISTNPSMIIGGLKVGVSALDMAHAYETFATGGVKVYNPALGDPHGGPIGIAQIRCPAQTGCPERVMVNHPTYQRVMPAPIAQEVGQILTTVVQSGTATNAQIPGVFAAGKTGTTENYGDAWFVGWTPKLTVAVWVGYPNGLRPMTTQWNGGPVEGGTYPAVIWHNFMTTALQILTQEAAAKAAKTGTTTTTTAAPSTSTAAAPATTVTSAPTTTAPTTSTPATATSPTTPATGGTQGTGGTTGTGAPPGTTGTPPAGGTTGTTAPSGGAPPTSGGAGIGTTP